MTTPESEVEPDRTAPPTNDAPLDVAFEATATRAEQPAVYGYPAEPMPLLAPPTEAHGM